LRGIELEPGASRLTVHKRGGESFRVKLGELGPMVYQELTRRIPGAAQQR